MIMSLNETHYWFGTTGPLWREFTGIDSPHKGPVMQILVVFLNLAWASCWTNSRSNVFISCPTAKETGGVIQSDAGIAEHEDIEESHQEMSSVSTNANVKDAVHEKSDFLVAYSTVPGRWSEVLTWLIT